MVLLGQVQGRSACRGAAPRGPKAAGATTTGGRPKAGTFELAVLQPKVFCLIFIIFPQQRKLMGSSAQISTGVRRCGSQEQVPEEGSGRFRKVPESSGVCWCRFRSRVPEGSGRFRRMLA